jgi:CheY-like chemotaxis protein
VIDPLKQLNAMQTLLVRSIGEHIRLNISTRGPVSHIKVDPSRFENALLNVCINARDAMPDGGTIDITLGNTRLNLSDSNHYSDVIPGEYVEIMITDTGHGIPQELVQKVFDPFFTTKEKGKGTGLGLSMVFGFVRQSGGHISLDSSLGQGTQLALYLPAVAAPEPVQFSAPATRSREFIPARILLAEDDPLVREYAALQLRNAGYEVKVTADGVEALEQLQQDGPFDLLFTDVLMPEMNGPELARQAVQVQPGLKVVFTSVFLEGEELEQVLNTPLTHLLPKPYQREDLLALIREVLAKPNPHSTDSRDRP